MTSEKTPTPSSAAALADVIDYLLGAGPLEGWYWGEQPGARTPYWWRQNLRKAWDEYRHSLARCAEVVTDEDAVNIIALKFEMMNFPQNHSQAIVDFLHANNMHIVKVK